MIKLKRIYDEPEPSDGFRVLVDRLWPRGVRKADAALDMWMREVAPSNELRKWFDHDPAKWGEFRRRYHLELQDRSDKIEQLETKDSEGTLTLLYAARDTMHNNAVVLRDFLNQKQR